MEEAVPRKKQDKPGLCAGLRAETLRQAEGLAGKLVPGVGIEPTRPFRARDFKLRRLAGVSAAGSPLRAGFARDGGEREHTAEIPSIARDLKRQLVPGVGIEPTRPFRGPGF